MKVNIYYGGRGLIDDPTLYVMNRMTQVLQELRVEVTRYNLYEEKNSISVLPKTLKEADGIILATTVEWLGIGGFMQTFLDACWLYGDKEKMSQLYMLPIVMATTYGEMEAQMNLIQAWEMLGGIPCDGISAYVEDHVAFETNLEYGRIIEKKAESLYRSISQKTKPMPSSNNAVKQTILRSNNIDLTPQESEQLSMYVSDDVYVKKQKADIEELTQMFKEMLGDHEEEKLGPYIKELTDAFRPLDNFKASYALQITDLGKFLLIEVQNQQLNCSYQEEATADVMAKTTQTVMNKLTQGKTTFQQAFMEGDISAKGNFKTLRTFDTLFQFGQA